MIRLISFIALALALWVGFKPAGDAPPLGPFLNPVHGVWGVARTAELPSEHAARIETLSGEVDVRYDDRGVPHIFAHTALDAYRALGYVHARDRLFQMEATQRAVAGTLTELLGERALPLDREARRQGLARYAEKKWNALDSDSPSRASATAYMDGVNSYIAQLKPAELPLEYRLLNRQPRRFSGRDAYYLLARMSLTLAWSQWELRMGAVEELIGKRATEALFPVNSPIQEPIEPVSGRDAPRVSNQRFPDPELADIHTIASFNPFENSSRNADLLRGEGVVGSNNWAVAPSRSASGAALLSGDPHLQLTLPSIWYEAHLVVPGELDVYGVTLPLAPLTPIGFNRDVAWTATNTGADVLDFYYETVDDSTRPTSYMLDGMWHDLERVAEEYRDKDGNVIASDTSYFTHRGPMTSTSLGWLSLRWTAHELSDEADPLSRAAYARNAEEWYAAMESFKAPAQNFLVADRSGNIGIRSTGRFPIRPGNGRGDRVFDGSTRASDWTGEWDISSYPQSLNPEQGFIASANQQPLDPSVRPGYLGWDWPTPWRAMRINEILRSNSSVTVDDMRRAHTDPYSALVPALLGPVAEAVEGARSSGALGENPSADEIVSAAEALSNWDRKFTPESSGAVLFDALLAALDRRTWDELFIAGENRRIVTPNNMILAHLMSDPNSLWWDDISTPGTREDRNTILIAALADAWRDAVARRGNDATSWRWGDTRKINIHHLLRLQGLGRTDLEVVSGPGTLSPSGSNGTHGASWRFVVEMGDTVRAWGTYPGGQSGNPVSTRYADRIGEWQRGELSRLHIPSTPDELGANTVSTLTLRPE